MPALGSALLLAAFVTCAYAVAASVAGARRRSTRLIDSGTGAFYLVTALMTVGYLVARRIGAPKSASAAAAVIVGTSSDVVTSAATIGPDTATAVTGGLVILAAPAYDRSRRSLLLLLAAVAAAALTKLTVFTAVGIAIVILVARALAVRRRGGGKALRLLGLPKRTPIAKH